MACEMEPLYCTACNCYEPVSSEWRLLWVDSDGALHVSPRWGETSDQAKQQLTDEVEHAEMYASACGRGSVLKLTERFMDTGSFATPSAIRHQ